MTSKNENQRNNNSEQSPVLLLMEHTVLARSADIKQIITHNDDHVGQVL